MPHLSNVKYCDAMDLNEISTEQALVDLGIANARIVDLSCQIELASSNLLHLRQELARLQAGYKQTSVITEKATHTGPATTRRSVVKRASLPKLLRWRTKALMLTHIDEVCGRPLAIQGGSGTHVVSSREFRSLTVSGWAIPRNFSGFFSSVEVIFRSEAVELKSRAETFPRDDVAKHFSNPTVRLCGFKIDIAMASIKPGNYVVELHGETSQGSIVFTNAFNLEVA